LKINQADTPLDQDDFQTFNRQNSQSSKEALLRQSSSADYEFSSSLDHLMVIKTFEQKRILAIPSEKSKLYVDGLHSPFHLKSVTTKHKKLI
jgi:hypothetical protein